MTPIFTLALGAWITNDPVGQVLLVGAALAAAGVLVILVRGIDDLKVSAKLMADIASIVNRLG